MFIRLASLAEESGPMIINEIPRSDEFEVG